LKPECHAAHSSRYALIFVRDRAIAETNGSSFDLSGM